jgi:Arc/MetJ-type ribon-helix-helix transcriptional regulator
MVNVTFSLPDETVEKLRRLAKARGRRGGISELVNAAVTEHLRELESVGRREEFFALHGQREVARAGSLRELARLLEGGRIDPRDVEIRSVVPAKPVVRTGLRGVAR